MNEPTIVSVNILLPSNDNDSNSWLTYMEQIYFIWIRLSSMPMRTKHLDITAHPTINIIILPACQIISLTNTIRCVWGAMSSGRRWANPIVAAPIDGGADTPVGVVVASDSEVEFCARGVLPHLQPINVINNVTHAFECIFIWMLWERVVVDKNPPLCLCYAFPASEDIF